jgi:nicotinate-nucleotide adenylyltransferase
MEIGLYFGSFNPIHHGHLIIANHVYQHTGLQQIWFVVTPQNPFKQNHQLLNEYQRLHLVQVAIEGEDHLRASDIEFKLPKPSYTIDTLTYLREKYPQHQFSLILGGDSFQNLPKWKNGDIILRDYPLYIYQRPGFGIATPENAKQITILDAPLLELSSTRIRQAIKEKKSIRYLVPDSVAQEIEQNNYYRS